MKTITLRSQNFTPAEIKQIVALHREQIGQGFLSSLGDLALGLIYSLAAAGNSGLLLAVVDETTGHVGGFVCGTVSVSAFYREFLRHHFFTALRVIGPKLLAPARLGRAVETLLYPAKKDVAALPPAELLTIAVAPPYQGQGLAQALFAGLVEAFRAHDIPAFKVVAGGQLQQAQRFYQKQGPVRIETIEVHHGQPSRVYVYDISGD